MAGPFDGRTGRHAHISRTAMGTVRFEKPCLSFVAIRSRFVQRACAVRGQPQAATRRVRS